MKKKKVLVIYYSQTGQLKSIVDNFVRPWNDEGLDITVDYYKIQPKDERPYPFPWSIDVFFNTFPESFGQIPVEIVPPGSDLLGKSYDLVILAYQIWFLTPSIPVNSFLKSEYAEKLLGGKKVITLIGCRNMWAKAQQKVKVLVEDNRGTIIGNVAFVDKHLNHISVVTIGYWMLKGKKNKKWGIFPKPGVSEEDIKGASAYGKLILKHWQNDDFSELQNEIKRKGGVDVHDFILYMDETANKMFTIWSRFILKNPKNRSKKVVGFTIYLLAAIWLISPIVYVLFLLTYPFRFKERRKKRLIYCGI